MNWKDEFKMGQKQYAEINGYLWEASYPFCAGCSELICGGGCGYAGSGCRYPEERIKQPLSFYCAFFEIAKQMNVDAEQLGKNLGNCILLTEAPEDEK